MSKVMIAVGVLLLLFGFIGFYLVYSSTRSQSELVSHVLVNSLLSSSNSVTSWDVRPPGNYEGEFYTLEVRIATSGNATAEVWKIPEQGTPVKLKEWYVGVYTWSLPKHLVTLERTFPIII